MGLVYTYLLFLSIMLFHKKQYILTRSFFGFLFLSNYYFIIIKNNCQNARNNTFVVIFKTVHGKCSVFSTYSQIRIMTVVKKYQKLHNVFSSLVAIVWQYFDPC